MTKHGVEKDLGASSKSSAEEELQTITKHGVEKDLRASSKSSGSKWRKDPFNAAPTPRRLITKKRINGQKVYYLDDDWDLHINPRFSTCPICSGKHMEGMCMYLHSVPPNATPPINDTYDLCCSECGYPNVDPKTLYCTRCGWEVRAYARLKRPLGWQHGRYTCKTQLPTFMVQSHKFRE